VQERGGGRISLQSSILGPAELGEGLDDAGEREADDVEVASFDAWDVAAGAALDGVGAGFVVGLFGGEVTGDFFGRDGGELDLGGFDEAAALGVGEADDGDAGNDGVSLAGETLEDAAGVVGGMGFADDAAIEGDDGVGGDDDGGADSACGDEFGFGVGEALDVLMGSFVGEGGLVDGGGEDGEGDSGVAQDFCAAG